MGTAFGVCFGYWLGGAGFFYAVAFMCSTHLTFLQILSLSVSTCIQAFRLVQMDLYIILLVLCSALAAHFVAMTDCDGLHLTKNFSLQNIFIVLSASRPLKIPKETTLYVHLHNYTCIIKHLMTGPKGNS